MKKLVFSVVAGLALSALQSYGAEAEWLKDFSKAKSTAKAEKKIILMDFTGSNW